MSDIVSQPNDSTEVSLRKAVELLGQIETKTGAAEITGEVTVSNEVEIKNNDNNPVPVSGTVTAQGFDAANELAAPIPLNDGATAVVVQPEGIVYTASYGEQIDIGTVNLTANTAAEISSGGNGVNGFNTVVLEINTNGVTFGSTGIVAQAHNQTISPTDQQIMCPLGVRITHSADSATGLNPSNLGTVGYVNLEPNTSTAGYHGTRLNAYENDNSTQTSNLPATGTRFFIFDLTTSRFSLKASFTAGTITVNYRLYRTRHPVFSARKMVVSGELGGAVRVNGGVEASITGGSVYMDGGYLDDTTSITSAVNDALDDSGVSGVSGKLGATTDASATTDTGTFSLISLFKRLLGKLPSLTASSRVPADVLPSSVTLVNAGSNFLYGSAGNYGAFDCGDADFVVFTTAGGGGGYVHNIELSNASNFSSSISTASGQVLVYNERYPTANEDTIAYRYTNSNLQSGSSGTYVINLTQGTTKYTHVRLAVSGGGGGSWAGRFTSYRSALRDAGANSTQMFPLHRVPIAGVVDINSCTRAIPITGGPLAIQPRNGAVTKTRGTTSSTANTSATAPSPLNVADSNRRYLLIQNISDTDMYVNFGAAATTDDLLIPKNGGGVVFESGFVPNDTVNVICSGASKKYFILSA